jgi:hypothetical protein
MIASTVIYVIHVCQQNVLLPAKIRNLDGFELKRTAVHAYYARPAGSHSGCHLEIFQNVEDVGTQARLYRG